MFQVWFRKYGNSDSGEPMHAVPTTGHVSNKLWQNGVLGNPRTTVHLKWSRSKPSYKKGSAHSSNYMLICLHVHASSINKFMPHVLVYIQPAPVYILTFSHLNQWFCSCSLMEQTHSMAEFTHMYLHNLLTATSHILNSQNRDVNYYPMNFHITFQQKQICKWCIITWYISHITLMAIWPYFCTAAPQHMQ